jgi:hypothetical protein
MKDRRPSLACHTTRGRGVAKEGTWGDRKRGQGIAGDQKEARVSAAKMAAWTGGYGDRRLCFEVGATSLETASGSAGSPTGACFQAAKSPKCFSKAASIVVAAGRRELRQPATTIVGEVVQLREQLHWFEDRPLFGRRIVVTRPRMQAGSQIQALRDMGADVVAFLPSPSNRFRPRSRSSRPYTLS